MTRKQGKVERADSGAVHRTDDFAIYPHRDHVKADAIPFNLNDYGDRGALSEQQKLVLSEQHGLSMAQVRELSRLIGYALDIDSEVSLVTISRSTAERRLHDRSLAKRNRDQQLSAAEANALFDGFGLNVIVADDTVLSGEDAVHSKAPGIRIEDLATVSLDEARRILQPNDRSKERDNRRLLVVESCCYVALDAGWELTYTTDFSAPKDQRGGRLINLIKNVIALVSHNARIASVHTLKKDIELVRRRFELRGNLPDQARKK